MRWSSCLIPTLREEPKDAEATSHRLMLRAGLIRKLASGIYSYLPLGYRILKKVEQIICEEMEAAGASEVLLPAIHPVELWQKSGRFDLMRDILMVSKVRGEQLMILGPTHEEVVTDLVSAYVKSYNDLPLILFQIQTKFRDEPRPRFGVVRSREFIMKDAYSFDCDAEGLEKSYVKMYQAYERIFNRCGLECVVVQADPGAMGGNVSHEFMVRVEFGEDWIVSCKTCATAWNQEVASGKAPAEKSGGGPKKLEEFDTPQLKTIEQLTQRFGLKAQELVKTLIYVVDGRPVACLIRGDHEVCESKLRKLLDSQHVQLADESTIQTVTGAPLGFAGPVGLKDIPIIADLAVLDLKNFVTGANKKDAHLKNVNVGRDFQVSRSGDLRYVKAGDLCPKCSVPLEIESALELGHVFKLGTRYSDVFDLTYLNKEGKEQKVMMGCYGIGVNRILAAAIEQHHDDKGISWPLSIAPFSVDIIVVNQRDEASCRIAEDIYNSLLQKKIDVLYDDRQERAGVKFNDADLIGFPIQIIIGERNIKQNQVEIKLRQGLVAEQVAISNVVPKIEELLKAGKRN